MTFAGGEIYFIRERDLISNELTEYFKVGIVREGGKNGRNSEDRLKDHQTGNPRELVLDEVFKTPLAEKLETIVQAINAEAGIRGEWMRIQDGNIDLIKSQLVQLVDEAKSASPIMTNAEELKSKSSNGTKLQADDDALKWHAVYSRANLSIAYYEPIVKRINSLILDAIEKGEDVAKVAKIQEKKTRFDLDEDALKAAHPDIYALFFEIVVSEPTGKFVPKKVPTDQDLIDNVLMPLTSEIVQVVERVETGELGKVSLHKPWLSLWGLLAKESWDKEVALANLKVICGLNSGIEDVCTWNRLEKKTEKFNKSAFKEAHPELYEKFQKEIQVKAALIVDKNVGYAD